VLAWNSAALDLGQNTKLPADYFNRLGEIIYGENPEFRADVRFIANQRGFIVQEITRTLNVQGNIIDQELYKGSNPLEKDLHYWEIFYVGKPEASNFISYEIDSYLLGSEDGNYEEGSYSITGISTFYPLSKPINLKYNKDGNIIPSPELIQLFGTQTSFDGNADLNFGYAGGLPVSNTIAPTMYNLQPSYYQLVRTITGQWKQSEDIVVKEQFNYRVYNSPLNICSPFILPRSELMSEPDTAEKKAERIQLANHLKIYLTEEEKRNITQEIADTLIMKLISENYTDSGVGGGGTNKKKTKRKRTKRKRTKRKRTKRKRTNRKRTKQKRTK